MYAALVENGLESLHQGIHQSVFMSSMVAPPCPSSLGGRDLPLCWEQHCKLLPGVHQYNMSDVAHWDPAAVAAFVSTLPGCKDLADRFQDQVRNLSYWAKGIDQIPLTMAGNY